MTTVADVYQQALKMPPHILKEKMKEAKLQEKGVKNSLMLKKRITQLACMITYKKRFKTVTLSDPATEKEIIRLVGQSFYRYDFVHNGSKHVLYYSSLAEVKNVKAKKIFGNPNIKGNVVILGATASIVQQWTSVSLASTKPEAIKEEVSHETSQLVSALDSIDLDIGNESSSSSSSSDVQPKYQPGTHWGRTPEGKLQGISMTGAEILTFEEDADYYEYYGPHGARGAMGVNDIKAPNGPSDDDVGALIEEITM